MNWIKILFPYRTHLEDELKQQREDFTARLAEKDASIRALRLELAQVKADNERMRLVLMPLGSPAGQLYAAKFQNKQPFNANNYVSQGGLIIDPPQDWQGELTKMLKEEEDGIRSGRRIQEHEPRADDGA